MRNAKPTICAYFHVHQPIRLKRFSVFNESSGSDYSDHPTNRHYFNKVARQCYLTANGIMLDLLEHHPEFKASYSITGTFVEQCESFPEGREVLDSFKRLFSTGRVELVGETYYHSLAGLQDADEFREQVRMHSDMAKAVFNQRPRVFRNTELLYNNQVAAEAEAMGFHGILAEGIERLLGWRSPNYVYRRKDGRIKVLLRNYKLSDDVGYRFSARWWPEWPLMADKYASWLSACEGQTINLFMDYETFGEHHWPGSGIFDFLRHFPGEAERAGLSFRTVSETLDAHDAVGEIDSPWTVSWADLERDESAWLGNRLQRACNEQLKRLGPDVKELGDAGILHAWRLMQTSDNLYYMCTKSWADGDVHKHFSPHKDSTPFDSFISFMNILNDFKATVSGRLAEKRAAQKMAAAPAEPAGPGGLSGTLPDALTGAVPGVLQGAVIADGGDRGAAGIDGVVS